MKCSIPRESHTTYNPFLCNMLNPQTLEHRRMSLEFMLPI